MSISSGSDLSDYEDITDTYKVEEDTTTLKVLDNTKPCICDSVEEATRFLHSYEISNSVRFAALSTPKSFGSSVIHGTQHKVLWETSEDYATPYIILSTKRYNCHHGFDRNAAAKRKHNEAKENQKVDHLYITDYVIIQDTKRASKAKIIEYSNIDQDCLEIKIKEWKEADSSANIYFRPKEQGNSAELLFVYQAFWQKKTAKKIWE
nr:uncharacterized protein LOC105845236 [Hydra vulgaris]